MMHRAQTQRLCDKALYTATLMGTWSQHFRSHLSFKAKIHPCENFSREIWTNIYLPQIEYQWQTKTNKQNKTNPNFLTVQLNFYCSYLQELCDLKAHVNMANNSLNLNPWSFLANVWVDSTQSLSPQQMLTVSIIPGRTVEIYVTQVWWASLFPDRGKDSVLRK